MFASCMRQHGIASFPDPHVTPGEHIVSMVVPASIGGSPQFQIAQNACAGILPTPGAVAQAANAQREAHKLGLPLEVAEAESNAERTAFHVVIVPARAR